MPEETQLMHPWLPQYVGTISNNNNLPGLGINLDPLTGVEVSTEATDDGIRAAISAFAGIRHKNRIIMLMMDRYLGQLVVAYANRHDTDWASAISELDLADFTGKSFSSLRKLPRIVSQVPDRLFQLPNITTTHMDVVTSFSGPVEDYEKMREFNNRRWELLETVSENDEEWPKARIANEMRKIQMSFGVLPKRSMPVSYTVDRFIRTSIMLVNFTDADFEVLGTTRREAMEHWEAYQNELIERGKITVPDANPNEFSLPWVTPDAEPEPQTVETEVLSIEVPEPIEIDE